MPNPILRRLPSTTTRTIQLLRVRPNLDVAHDQDQSRREIVGVLAQSGLRKKASVMPGIGGPSGGPAPVQDADCV